jgi:ribosome-associated heat shock protein Hsp15
MRIDKWLWAARFFKTRVLAQQAIERGKVRREGESIKPAREVKAGDRLEVTGAGERGAQALPRDRRKPPQARGDARRTPADRRAVARAAGTAD